MPTATKTKPSTELTKLESKRDKSYAALQEIKRKRSAHEDETQAARASYSAFVNAHREDWADEARNPKPGSPSAKLEAEVKARLNSPNPHDEGFAQARSEFHAADDELQAFRRSSLPALIAEDLPEFNKVQDTYREALGLLIEVGDGYDALLARVDKLVRDTDVLTGQHVAFDPFPAQLRKLAIDGLDHELTPPGISELAEWKLGQHAD